MAWGFLSLDGCSATLRYRPLLVMPIWTTIRFGELLRQSPFAFPRPCKASGPGRLLASLANVGVCDLKVRFPPKSGYRQGRLRTTLHGKSSGLRAIFQAKASSCESGRGPSKGWIRSCQELNRAEVAALLGSRNGWRSYWKQLRSVLGQKLPWWPRNAASRSPLKADTTTTRLFSRKPATSGLAKPLRRVSSSQSIPSAAPSRDVA